MEALLWLIPIAILGAGLFFLVRSFVRLSLAMKQVTDGLAELAEMGPRLQRLGKDVGDLTAALEEKRPK